MRKLILLSFFSLLININAYGLLGMRAKISCRCQPNETCWPSERTWENLAKSLNGKLVKPSLPLAACNDNKESSACKIAENNIKNPFFLQENSGSTESRGYFNAWDSKASAYAIEAKTTHDVVAGINFAREHNLRLAIKGAGHDYLGRSNAGNSLLIWTHNMREITYHSEFIPQGCPSNTAKISAMTVGAGTRWIEAYTEATTKHHHYVQGGGCTTVGAAGGFIQGGGFGSFSKNFGTGAAGVVQAEIVTADGQVRIANECQNQALFWAVRGGGGGTFGVVTKMTLRTHPLPKYFGIFQCTIIAKNADDYKTLIQHFLIFFRDHLNNPHWGEQFSFTPENSLNITLLTQGLSTEQVENTWKSFKSWTNENNYTFSSKYISVPPEKMWDYNYWEKNHPEFVVKDTRKNARPGEFWWAPNTQEAYKYWYTYQSWWLPVKLLSDNNISKTSDVIFSASRLSPLTFHINKGLAGASADAIARGKNTSTNPKVYDAAALIIIAKGSNEVQLGKNGQPIQSAVIQKEVNNITQAMQKIMTLAPNAGTYGNEANYFQHNWQNDFWGVNYLKLLRIKQQYDPQGLFYCHHCVGSEFWAHNGICRK